MTEIENSIKVLTEHTQHYVPTEDLEHLYAVIEAAEKVSKYETAEEDGRLAVLPCKVGDTVYAIENKYYEYLYHKGIQKGHVCRFEYDKEWFAWIHIDGCNKDLQIAYKTSNFNKTVFLTRGEAEKALKEMEKDDAAD